MIGLTKKGILSGSVLTVFFKEQAEAVLKYCFACSKEDLKISEPNVYATLKNKKGVDNC